MRKAFDAEQGPLRDLDPEIPKQEREAVAHLFAGAIGAFRNPTGHRRVDIDDPAEAANVLRLADSLLRIVDRARA